MASAAELLAGRVAFGRSRVYDMIATDSTVTHAGAKRFARSTGANAYVSYKTKLFDMQLISWYRCRICVKPEQPFRTSFFALFPVRSAFLLLNLVL